MKYDIKPCTEEDEDFIEEKLDAINHSIVPQEEGAEDEELVFKIADDKGIRYHDLPEGADSSFFLCRELRPGYLDGITGVYQTPQGYYVKDSDVEEFDRAFPPKEKLRLPGQIF